IPLLVEHFVARFNRLGEKDIAGVSDEAMALLMEYDFPGNVRELENVIEHAFVLCRGGLIRPEHLPPEVRAGGRATDMPRTGGTTLKAMERVLIADAVRRQGGNRSAAAKELGIDPSTLFRKVKTLGIELPEQDGRSGRGK
ncbi:MAG: helix-turn-helix domain-containing protein, partial [Planctomycetota bacterium]